MAIVIHNYRWRLGVAEGEPECAELEKRLAVSPVITVPTITLEGDANGAPSIDSACSHQTRESRMRARSEGWTLLRE